MFMDALVGNETLAKMAKMNSRFGEKSYQLADYMKDIQSKIWAELSVGGKIDAFRQNIQNNYLEKMATLLMPAGFNPMDIIKGLPIIGQMAAQQLPSGDPVGSSKALAMVNMEQLKNQIDVALKSGKFTDALTNAHLKMAQKQINRMLTAK